MKINSVHQEYNLSPAVVTCPAMPAVEMTSGCEASTPVPLTAGKYVNFVSCPSSVGLPPLLNGLCMTA